MCFRTFMELIPFWEPEMECKFQQRLWYLLSSDNELNSPGMRTGHSGTIVGNSLFLLCGANPDGAYSDLCEFNFATRKWNKYQLTGADGRYEHSSFCASSDPSCIYLFGGCTENGNSNSVLRVNLSGVLPVTETLEIHGQAPSPRTFQCNNSCDGFNFYVFGGGLENSKAVEDPHVYCFNIQSSTWKKLKNNGDVPSPRQGHSLSFVNKKLICFGGMNNGEFFGDLFYYDVEKQIWSKVKAKGSLPCARAAHACAVLGDKIVINGGLCIQSGSLQDVYILNTLNFKWQIINVTQPLPGNRLGHCIVRVPSKCLRSRKELLADWPAAVGIEAAGDSAAATSSTQSKEPRILDITDNLAPQTQDSTKNFNEEGSRPLMFTNYGEKSNEEESTDAIFVVYGGLDTGGIIFDDALLIKI